MADTRRFEGKTAVVTGAAGGIGGAVARALHAEGCNVAAVDLSHTPLLDLVGTLRSRATAHVLDVSDPVAWDALADEVRAAHGGADLLVNNAGLTVHGAFEDQTVADIERIVDVNLKGVMHGCRAFLPQLVGRPGAHIVNVSSLAGVVAFPYQSTYSATKFAVRGFSAALRMELAGRVGVTTVMPGAVATRLLGAAQSYDTAASRKMAELMLAYGVRPERVATRIVDAIRANTAEVSIGWDARATTLAHALAPRVLAGALSLGFRKRAGV